MKFLVDAQLPISLARFLQTKGYDTLHTRDLPQKNLTSDSQINEISLREQRIVITKDADFVNSFMTIRKPYKLLLITTGNIKNNELKEIFIKNLSLLVDLLQHHDYVEMNHEEVIVHQ